MTWIRRLALPGLLAVLCLAAASAHATLLVRSDGAGLLIQDKNGISDEVDMFSIPSSGGTTAWNIRNRNDFDVFKFDFQTGCERASSFEAECKRFGPVISVVLVAGDDRFSIVSASPSAQSSVLAGSGDDEVSGHGGHDDLNGGTGDDELAGAGGTDSVDGRDGADHLEGGPGNDEVDGDAGADVLIGGPGFDDIRGDENNDAVFAREPTAVGSLEDTVACGSGTDFAELDLKDVFTSCEQRDIAPVGETPNVRLPVRNLRVARAGRVRARLRCPRGVHDLGCKGTLRLKVAGGGATRKVRYRIKAARAKNVRLKLRRGDVRRLRRAQRRGRTSRGVLTSREKGRIGPKTTVRNPRLRVR